jgi:hypothetical protein
MRAFILLLFTASLIGISAPQSSASGPPYAPGDNDCLVRNTPNIVESSPDCNGSITIPSEVTEIADSAFSNNTSLTSISIPNSVVRIGSNAFAGTGLTSISIPGSVTTIGDAAFQQIENLATVVIEEGIVSLPSQAFYNNFSRSIINVTLPNTLVSIGPAAFFGAGITAITIPNSVTTIGVGAFRESGLTSVTIPNSVTTIGAEAFFGNTALTFVRIGNSVTTIDDYAFSSNPALTTVFFGNEVASIGSNAFSDNSSLYFVSFSGNTAPTVGSNPFAFISTSETPTAYVSRSASGFGIDGSDWNGLRVSLGDAPAFTLSSSSEISTVNVAITGYTLTSTGETVDSFSISPTIPSGLSFDSSTGLLSGTPTTAAAATSYTIIATNSWGTASRTFTLTVNANTPTQSDSTLALVAAAKRDAERRIARADLLGKINDGRDLTADLFAKAEISGITPKNIGEFQSEIFSLSPLLRSDITQVLKVSRKYELVDVIASERVELIYSNSLVEIGLIPAESKYKATLTNAVKKQPPANRSSYKAIQEVITQEMNVIQARQDRLARIKAQIALRRSS